MHGGRSDLGDLRGGGCERLKRGGWGLGGGGGVGKAVRAHERACYRIQSDITGTPNKVDCN